MLASSSGTPRRLGNSTLSPSLALNASDGLALAVDRGVDQAGRDGVEADADRGEVAGDGEGHADDAALGGGVRRLADLAVEGGDAGQVDDGAALAGLGRLVAGDRRTDEADAVEGADQVDRDDLGEGLEVGGGARRCRRGRPCAAPSRCRRS